jgi:hypothetical protein
VLELVGEAIRTLGPGAPARPPTAAARKIRNVVVREVLAEEQARLVACPPMSF